MKRNTPLVFFSRHAASTRSSATMSWRSLSGPRWCAPTPTRPMKGNHGWNMDNGFNNPETRPSIPLLWPLPSRPSWWLSEWGRQSWKSQPLVGVASGLGAVGHRVGSGATTPAGKGGYQSGGVPAGWPSSSRSDLCGAGHHSHRLPTTCWRSPFVAGYDWAPDEVMPVDIDHIKRNFRKSCAHWWERCWCATVMLTSSARPTCWQEWCSSLPWA